MKSFLPAIAALALVVSCVPGINNLDEHNPEDVTESTMCSVDLSEITEGTFDKLVFKDMDHYILFTHREDGLPDHCVVQCETDTLVVAYDENGLPNVFSDGETYMFVGGYSGRTARICVVDPDNVSDVEEIELDVDVDEYLNRIHPSKASTQANNLAKLTEKSVYEKAFDWYSSWCMGKKGSVKPSIGGVAAYLSEAALYMASDNEQWQKLVSDEFYWCGITVTVVQSLAGANPYFALGWAIKSIYWDKIYVPLRDGGYLLPSSDPRSAYGDEIQYYYQHIGSIVFGTRYRKYPWYGDSFDNEIITGGANYDVQANDFVIGEHPDWIVAEPVQKSKRNYLRVYCTSNDKYESRSHVLKLSWPNPKGGVLETSFGISQNPRPCASPSSITLSTTSPVRVTVMYAVDGFEIYDSPLWCTITALGNDYFELRQRTDVQNPEPGQIVLSIPSKNNTWVPLYVAIYPESLEDESTPGLAIDLGLSVKWASCNVGAAAPEQFGGYYAWGETSEKDDYSWSTYKWGNATHNLTKYCTDSDYGYNGFVDYKTELDSSDDVAHVKLGGNWRMPTDAEWYELITKCAWTMAVHNGIDGLLFTGPNGNSIFLPAAGRIYGTTLHNVGSFGGYWSSSLGSEFPYGAWGMSFNSGGVNKDDYGRRYRGHSVRPVTE